RMRGLYGRNETRAEHRCVSGHVGTGFGAVAQTATPHSGVGGSGAASLLVDADLGIGDGALVVWGDLLQRQGARDGADGREPAGAVGAEEHRTHAIERGVGGVEWAGDDDDVVRHESTGASEGPRVYEPLGGCAVDRI